MIRILVCLSYVPDTSVKISFDEDGMGLVGDHIPYVIGPYEDYALARAVELREGGLEISLEVLHVGLAESDAILRKALAIGADKAYRIDQSAKSSYEVARQIASFVSERDLDMVLMGRETTDFSGGMVHTLVGHWLGWPVVCPVMRLDVPSNGKVVMQRELEGGSEEVEVPLPFVAGCQEPIAEWRIPSIRGIMGARSKPLEVLKGVETKAIPGVDLLGFEALPPRQRCAMIPANAPSELWQRLREEKKVL